MRRLPVHVPSQHPHIRKGMHAHRAPCIVSGSGSGDASVLRTSTIPEGVSACQELKSVATSGLGHVQRKTTQPSPRTSHGQVLVGTRVAIWVVMAVILGGTLATNAEQEQAVNMTAPNRTALLPRPDPPYGIPDSVIPFWRQRHYQDRILPPEGRFDPISKVFVCVSPKAGSTSFYRWLFRVSTDGVEFDECETKKVTDHPHRMSDCWQDSGLPGHERHHRVNFTDPTL